MNGRVAHERGSEIRHLIAAKRAAFHAAQVGRKLSALTLDETADGVQVALSSNYLKVALPGSNIARNTLLDVQVERADGNLIYGYPAVESSIPPAGLLATHSQAVQPPPVKH